MANQPLDPVNHPCTSRLLSNFLNFCSLTSSTSESFAAIEEAFAEENDGKERGNDVSDVFQVGSVLGT
jgi:hypothetical protein